MHPRRRGAVLAGVEVAGDRDRLGRRRHIGVVEDDDGRLAAELEVHPLEVVRRGAARPRGRRAREPVIATICGVGCATSARPVSRSPHTTLSTPGGRNSANSSASISVVAGVVSLGLSTRVLPAASAGAIFQIAIISG